MDSQVFNLPVPLPIRDPIGFLVKGRCGKILSQVLRLVSSERLEDLFIKSFILKILLLLNLKGCNRRKPTWPKVKQLELEKRGSLLILWRDLYLNFLGCNNK